MLSNILSGFSLVGFNTTLFMFGLRFRIESNFRSFVSPAKIQYNPFPYYYDLKESEIRQLERIEEDFLRELFKTSKGCPLTQLYLEGGIIPAKFEIIRIRLLFLKTILNQKQDSMLFKFFKIQLESSSKTDWTTTCMTNLEELKIEKSFDEIRAMSDMKYKIF